MTFKVLIIGDAGSGKTSLRTQFFHKSFTLTYRATIGANFLTKHITLPRPRPQSPIPSSLPSSLPLASPSAKRFDHSGTFSSSPPTTTTTTNTSSPQPPPNPDSDPDLDPESCITVSLCIWDTAGQERFNSLSPTFYRGSDCAILLYDVTNLESLNHLSSHYREFKRYSGTTNPVIVIVGNKIDAVRVPSARERETGGFEGGEMGGGDDARRRAIVASLVAEIEGDMMPFPSNASELSSAKYPSASIRPDQRRDERREEGREERGERGDGRKDTGMAMASKVFEVSAKTGLNVPSIFHEIATSLYARDERRHLVPFELDDASDVLYSASKKAVVGVSGSGANVSGVVDLKSGRGGSIKGASVCSC